MSVATLRLFAQLREIAGTSRLSIDGGTVGTVLAEANRRFGEAFEASAAHSRVWRNGEAASLEDPVAPGDEIALIPPVSGGAREVGQRPTELQVVALVAVGALLVLANVVGGDPLWAAAVVGVVSVWVVGLRPQFPPAPPLAATIGSVTVTHLLGSPGYAIGVGLALAVALAWPVFNVGRRSLRTLAATVLTSVWAAAAAASLVLARQVSDPGSRVMAVFLFAAVGSALLGAVLSQIGNLRFLDPLTAMVLAALAASVGGALVWDFDPIAFLLIGVGIGLGLIAGRGLGSIVRVDQVMLVDRLPGALAFLDGPLMAAVVYFPLLRLLV